MLRVAGKTSFHRHGAGWLLATCVSAKFCAAIVALNVNVAQGWGSWRRYHFGLIETGTDNGSCFKL